MTVSGNKAIWDALLAFQFDEPETKFTFAQRLARENGWSSNYTARVILEYKRFIYLCTVNSTGVTPSDPVDQAWHLHLTYTDSYWNKMCKDILAKDIHHNPTKGGENEGKKYNAFYDRTRELYKLYFHEDQPLDIWHNNDERFSDINFQRVNLNRYWMLRKPKIFVRYKTLSLLAMASALFFVGMSGGAIFLLIVLAILFIIFMIWLFSDNNKNGGSSGGSSSSSGCGFFFIGCGSSDGGSSGCGSSGCSGCGGGGCSS